jgi:hypothetical protein
MKTAVEWLIEEMFKQGYLNDKPLTIKNIERFVNQAKEMEKEQIIQARTTAPIIPTIDMIDYVKESEQYYNETFK